MRSVLLAAFFLGGCVLQYDAISTGQDTYTVSRKGWVGAHSEGELKAGAYDEARLHCGTTPSKYMSPLGATVRGTRAFPEVEVQFRCVSVEQTLVRRGANQ